jgi:hypothetical protein
MLYQDHDQMSMLPGRSFQSILCKVSARGVSPIYPSTADHSVSTHQHILNSLQAQVGDAVSRSRAILGAGRGAIAWRKLRAVVKAGERRCASLRASIAEKEQDIAAGMAA